MDKVLNQIKTLRILNGLNQSDLADRLSIEQGTYGKIERGQITLDVPRLFQIAQILKVDPCFLISGENNSTSELIPKYKYDELNEKVVLLQKLIKSYETQLSTIK